MHMRTTYNPNIATLKKVRRQMIELIHDFEENYIKPLQSIESKTTPQTKQALQMLYQAQFDVIRVNLADEDDVRELMTDYRILYYFMMITKTNTRLIAITPFDEITRPDIDEVVLAFLRHHTRLTLCRNQVDRMRSGLANGRNIQKSTHTQMRTWLNSQQCINDTVYAITKQNPHHINQILGKPTLENVRTLTLNKKWLDFAPPVLTK